MTTTPDQFTERAEQVLSKHPGGVDVYMRPYCDSAEEFLGPMFFRLHMDVALLAKLLRRTAFCQADPGLGMRDESWSPDHVSPKLSPDGGRHARSWHMELRGGPVCFVMKGEDYNDEVEYAASLNLPIFCAALTEEFHSSLSMEAHVVGHSVLIIERRDHAAILPVIREECPEFAAMETAALMESRVAATASEPSDSHRAPKRPRTAL